MCAPRGRTETFPWVCSQISGSVAGDTWKISPPQAVKRVVQPTAVPAAVREPGDSVDDVPGA